MNYVFFYYQHVRWFSQLQLYQFESQFTFERQKTDRLEMFYDDSFTKQPEDYLMNFVRNRMQNKNANLHQDDESSFRIDRGTFSGVFLNDRPDEQSISQQQNLNHEQDEEQFNNQNQQQSNDRFEFSQNADGFQAQQLSDQVLPGQTDSFEDSFLQVVDQHLTNITKKSKQPQLASTSLTTLTTSSCPISLSSHQISHSLLEKQTLINSLHLTNLTQTKCLTVIKNPPFQFTILDIRNKFIKKDMVQIVLDAYQTVEIQFLIKKRDGEIGNIYETLRIDCGLTSDTRQVEKWHALFVKFEITFVKPKIQVAFFGRTSVKRIQQHKVAHLNIYPNETNEYTIDLIFLQRQQNNKNSSQLEKIQCQIQTKGYISVHPTSIMLYKDQAVKLKLRKLTQLSGTGKTSVVLLKLVGSSLTYVLGVKFSESRQSKNEENTEKYMRLQL